MDVNNRNDDDIPPTLILYSRLVPSRHPAGGKRTCVVSKSGVATAGFVLYNMMRIGTAMERGRKKNRSRTDKGFSDGGPVRWQSLRGDDDCTRAKRR